MTYDDPIRLRVLKALTGLLETITPANGYAMDMAGRVYRGRTVFGHETDVPFISILEIPLPEEQDLTPDHAGATRGPWQMTIQGFVKDDERNPTDPAHILAADVRKCLVRERMRAERDDDFLGTKKTLLDMVVGPPVVRPADDVSSVSYFWLTLTLDIVEDAANPYDDE